MWRRGPKNSVQEHDAIVGVESFVGDWSGEIGGAKLVLEAKCLVVCEQSGGGSVMVAEH
jgi:hypothetical protein